MPTALAILNSACHNLRPRAGVAQWLERRPVTPEAAGSSPVIRAITTMCAAVAQSVEHSTENARVAGSNPACGTIKILLLLALLCLGSALAQDLTLRPHDRVRVSSTGSFSISGEKFLGDDGSVWLDGRKPIFLAGRSLAEASTEIQRVLGPGVGRVGIELLGPKQGAVSFRGAVRQSGSIGMRSPRTISDVLSIAEPTDAADLGGVIVISALGKTFRVDAEADPQFALRPGDQILVPQLSVPNEVLVLGAVKTPGAVPFRSQLTLEQAVEAAGGITGHALTSEIAVLRKDQPLPGADWTEEGRKTKLQRGDVVRIVSRENARYVSVIGEVKATGLIPFRPGMTLMEAIEAAGGTKVGAGLDAVEVRKVFSGRGRMKRYDLNQIKKGSPADPKLEAADIVYIPPFVFKEPKPTNTGFRPVVPP